MDIKKTLKAVNTLSRMALDAYKRKDYEAAYLLSVKALEQSSFLPILSRRNTVYKIVSPGWNLN